VTQLNLKVDNFSDFSSSEEELAFTEDEINEFEFTTDEDEQQSTQELAEDEFPSPLPKKRRHGTELHRMELQQPELKPKQT